MTERNRLVCILGPTASGKTSLAAHLAHAVGGEVISADSRQVYRGMDIGTGKDLDDYEIDGDSIRHHLIDVADPGDEYTVFDYQQAFLRLLPQIQNRNHLPILCGGSGLYLDAVLSQYQFVPVERDEALRAKLADASHDELVARLAALRPLHNKTDTEDHERLVRAIEIAEATNRNPGQAPAMPDLDRRIFGVRWPTDVLRRRIRRRLEARLATGMIEEVADLIAAGIDPDRLRAYGLEYRFIADHLAGRIDRQELTEGLYRAICKFAKRQRTWFRRMERRGTSIHWLDGAMPVEANLQTICHQVGLARHG